MLAEYNIQLQFNKVRVLKWLSVENDYVLNFL